VFFLKFEVAAEGSDILFWSDAEVFGFFNEESELTGEVVVGFVVRGCRE